MEVNFDKLAWKDLDYWLEHDIKILKRIRDLIKDIQRHPFSGIGKPEPLKGNRQGYWARRIDKKHRLTYYIANGVLHIVRAREHYAN